MPYKLFDLFADALFALSGLGKLDMDVDDWLYPFQKFGPITRYC